jgi:hypothetical protein
MFNILMYFLTKKTLIFTSYPIFFTDGLMSLSPTYKIMLRKIKTLREQDYCIIKESA